MVRDASTASVPTFALRHSTFTIPIRPALVMGVVNVTPDSFSDGGEYFDREAAVGCAMRMIGEGAAIIDVGPESTQPGSQGVPDEEQIRRALPVIEALRSRDAQVLISIDTRSAGVAQAALRAGADMVNDTSALRDDPRMVEIVAASKAGVVLMHRRGTPTDMQVGGGPRYDDVTREICDFLQLRRDFAMSHGIEPSRIVLDPGIGFGKRVEDNLHILRSLGQFVSLGQPLLLGVSRKRFLGSVLGIENPKQRDAGSLACAAIAAQAEASIIRTHDVLATVQAVRIVAAIGAVDSSVPKHGQSFV